MRDGITAHTIVRNEDKYIWFALHSVLEYVDQLFIYDTGSVDATRRIIKSISSPKIVFKQYDLQTPQQITHLRQRQLDDTQTKWFLILDGDEIWWQKSIQHIRKKILADSKDIWGIITPTMNCLGDVFHYQESRAGRYTFGNYTGHYAVRAIRRTIPGLHLKSQYPLEGYYDQNNQLITDNSDKLVYQKDGYMHMTNVKRSSLEDGKTVSREIKYELGNHVPPNFKFPEVFYQQRPDFVMDPFTKRDANYVVRATLETPLKMIKRRFIP